MSDGIDRSGLLHCLAHCIDFFNRTKADFVVVSWDAETEHLQERIDEKLLDNEGFQANAAFALMVSAFLHHSDAKEAILVALSAPETVAASKADAKDLLELMLNHKSTFELVLRQAKVMAQILGAIPELDDAYAKSFLQPIIDGTPQLVKREFIEALLRTGKVAAA